MTKIELLPTDALIVVDPQIDFCPGGALAVEGGDEIMTGIDALAERFADAGATIVVTQDWHPRSHKSFARTHYLEPFMNIQMPYGEQTLWPDHCVQGTPGADFHPDMSDVVESAALIIRKGMNPEIDSYSAFYENDKVTSTGLGGYLRSRGIKRCFFVGLAYDFCVGYSAIDASEREGFKSVVVKDLTRAIAMPVPSDGPITTVDLIEDDFQRAHVHVINANALSE